MNNEPVAWMAINKSTGIGYVQKDKPTRMNKMDNEYTALYEQTPVAWLAIGENTNVFFDEETALSIDKNATPLYTHPAKTLTDEEILEIAQLMFFDTRYPNIALNFARAILKKASEK
jgi:hypothetical protein